MTTIIAPSPPNDGREWDCQCARRGSSVGHEPCDACEYGEVEDHEDDTWSTLGGETRPCEQCDGRGGFAFCLSSPEWCEANPQPGREAMKRGAVEWFTVEERP